MTLTHFGHAILAIILVTGLPSLIFLTFLYSRPERMNQRWLISLAIGTMLGSVVYHLIPESLGIEDPPLDILTTLLAGIILFLFGERLLQHYHHGHGHSHFSPLEHQVQPGADIDEHGLGAHQIPTHIGTMIMSSDVVHGFVDGMAIGSSFMVSKGTGVSTTIAVFFHEVPHLWGDFAIFTATGIPKIQLVYYSIVIVAASITGSFLVNLLPFVFKESFKARLQQGLLAFAAGNFLYISLSDLIPEVLSRSGRQQSQPKIIHYVLVLIGALCMLILRLFFH